MRRNRKGRKLHEKILLSDIFKEYIPNYRCLLMQLKDYSNAELMEKGDELSIIMMVSKLHRAADFAGQVKERRMGELFSNFEAYDVQATRREAREEGKIEARNEDIEKLIKILRELAIPVEEIKLQLIKQYHLSAREIEEKIKNS